MSFYVWLREDKAVYKTVLGKILIGSVIPNQINPNYIMIINNSIVDKTP